jgi:hypothetical protein
VIEADQDPGLSGQSRDVAVWGVAVYIRNESYAEEFGRVLRRSLSCLISDCEF